MFKDHIDHAISGASMVTALAYVTATLAIPVMQLLQETPALTGSTYDVLSLIDSDGDGIQDRYDVAPYKR